MMHISIFKVEPATQEDFKRTIKPYGYRDTFWRLVELDNVPVKGKPVLITVRLDEGVPRLVYIDGGWPTYETFVYHDKTLIAHFGGHLREKDK